MTKIKPGSRVEQPDPAKSANPAPESGSHSKFGRTVSQAHAQTPMPDTPTNPSSALSPVSKRDVSTLTETEPSPQKDPVVKSGDVFKQCRGAAQLYYKNHPRLHFPKWQGERDRYHVAYARVYEELNRANIAEALEKKNEAFEKKNKGLENEDEKLKDKYKELKDKHEKLENKHEKLKNKVLPDEYKLIKSRLNLEKKNDGYHLNLKGISSTVQIIEHISNISCCLVLLGREEEALNYINAGYRYFEGEVVPALQDAEYDLKRVL